MKAWQPINPFIPQPSGFLVPGLPWALAGSSSNVRSGSKASTELHFDILPLALR